MAVSLKPTVQIQYNGKNITADISKYLLEFRYTDKLEGESDEIEITLEDAQQLWQGDWIASKGDKITASIGYVGSLMMNCGTFDVDEITLSGPPDTVRIKAIAAGINSPIRTKKSTAHENKTLAQIAKAVADANGLTVEGEIPNVLIERTTQNRESDLQFLHRISMKFGLVFSIRDTKIIFTDIFQLEASSPTLAFEKSDVSSYDFKDSAVKTYSKAVVAYNNSQEQEVIKYNASADIAYYSTVSEDTLEIKDERAENQQQAELIAKTKLHRKNTAGVLGSLGLFGNNLAVAGVNIELKESWKRFAGKWQITASTHTISRSGGYSTDIEIKLLK